MTVAPSIISADKRQVGGCPKQWGAIGVCFMIFSCIIYIYVLLFADGFASGFASVRNACNPPGVPDAEVLGFGGPQFVNTPSEANVIAIMVVEEGPRLDT